MAVDRWIVGSAHCSLTALHGPLHTAQLTGVGYCGPCASAPPDPRLKDGPNRISGPSRDKGRIESNERPSRRLAPRQHPPTTIQTLTSTANKLHASPREPRIYGVLCSGDISHKRLASTNSTPHVGGSEGFPRTDPIPPPSALAFAPWPPGWRAPALRHVASIPLYADALGVREDNIPRVGQSDCACPASQDQEGQIHDPLLVRRPAAHAFPSSLLGWFLTARNTGVLWSKAPWPSSFSCGPFDRALFLRQPTTTRRTRSHGSFPFP